MLPDFPFSRFPGGGGGLAEEPVVEVRAPSAEAPDPRCPGRADLPTEHQAADSTTSRQVSPVLGCQPGLKRGGGWGLSESNVPKRGSGKASTLIKYLLMAKAGHKPEKDQEARKCALKD